MLAVEDSGICIMGGQAGPPESMLRLAESDASMTVAIDSLHLHREPYPWRAAPSGRRTPASRDAPTAQTAQRLKTYGAAVPIMPRHDGRGSAHEERSRDEPHSRGGAGESE